MEAAAAASGGGGGVGVEMGRPRPTSPPSPDHLEKTRTLICALNLISRNLPLPPELFQAVSSIYQGGPPPHLDDGDMRPDVGTKGVSITCLKDALNQQHSCISGGALRKARENRLQSHIQHRLMDLEELPSSRGDDLQMKCLLELYGLKLAELQKKVRSDVSSEYWLHEKVAHPDKQLFDWGLQRPIILYGMGDAFAMESDKKKDIERISRVEQEEKNRMEGRKRKFFAEILNAAREFQFQGQVTLKRRKLRNDGIQAWHARQRQRSTRAEKLRLQALKADDQEAYMRMVEESKNERLTLLLDKTNELLVCLGAAVQRQKDAEHSDGIESLKNSEDNDSSQLPLSKKESPVKLPSEEHMDGLTKDSTHNFKKNDLLESQRQYNTVIHSIQEEVTVQPSMLQGGELRSYQLEGLQWMLSLFNNNLNGILADEMGLGKTIQTIALIAYLMENKDVTGPHLIIAPKGVLPNWINEFSTWAPSIVAVLYDGRLDERKGIREEYSKERSFNVMITHYDLIMRDKAFLKKIHWYYMIVDEGHRLKNRDCALVRTLVSGYRIRRRLLLTGTPIQNSLQELWALLNFLLPSIFNSAQNFEEWFNAPFADRGDVSLTDEEELLIIRRLHHVIRPFLLRRKKDEVEKYLPGKTQVVLKCDMSAWQRAYYKQIMDSGRVMLDSGTGKSKSYQNVSMQLRKCCNHPYLFVPEHNMWNRYEIIRASGKFELLDRLLPKLQITGHRILLFSQMTRLMDILEIYLQLHDFKYLRLDGSTKTEERGTLLQQFNAPDSPFFMFLLSTRAGGLGLNLQTADTVIIFDSDWNPQMDQQAEDRAHRIGQKKEVRVFVLVSVGSIEEEILERAKQKMGIDAKVIQAGLFNTTSTAQDRKEMLQEIMRRGTDSLGTNVPTEREINRLAARTEEEFRLFEKMDEERREREEYRQRLMEDHEVPPWVCSVPGSEGDKTKGNRQPYNYSDNILGKRRRTEVIYADLLSDDQWLAAVEGGEDLSSTNRVRRKRRKHQLETDEFNCIQVGEQKVSMQFKHLAGEESSEDFSSQVPENESFKSEPVQVDCDEVNGDGSSSSQHGGILTWKTHKRKRSGLAIAGSSSEARHTGS